MNIITLSTYPIAMPQHGGQHRLFNIVEFYRSAGHNVQAIGVLGSSQYSEEPGFVNYPGEKPFLQFIENPFLMEDWAIGELFYKNNKYFEELASCISMDVDVIHVEQPWLFRFAQRYVSSVNKKIKIVYGSQNIEHQLKRKILSNYLSREEVVNGENLVLNCELNAIKSADGVYCVSQHDADWVRENTSVTCLIVANGVQDRIGTIEGIKKANNFSGNHKFGLYCASAHLPNVVGFVDMFSAGIGCLSPDERILLAGGVGPSLQGYEKAKSIAGFNKFVVASGMVDEECLQGFIETAHAIILPITQGSGTNLKTAEALWSGKHIVATSTAMRGFENFSSSCGVHVTDNPSDFQHSIRRVMSEPPLILSKESRAEREVVLWENTLLPLKKMLFEVQGIL
ncbi:glycosyltransferase family 4 protein [Comamonas sp. Z1]|uniref:glycosyltransferase n=1 Tax=Comamonas sp. Z1 TaxID=2601246 RepID=UPI0011E60E12|nr:glycosyltransferase [Comamonas sp. Z1]TYK71946.1 glycosyltransferase family 4 protein [Comamonas sp. Z1]